MQYKKNALNAAKKYDQKYLALEMAEIIMGNSLCGGSIEK